MTKEQAIKEIDEYLVTADDAGIVFPVKFLTALDVVISAAKEPLCEACIRHGYCDAENKR